jgi:transposase-like protein
MRKKGSKNKVYSPEFKIAVVERMQKEKFSYHEVVREFGIGNPNIGGTRQIVQQWERIYLEEGAEGLMKERRGRTTKLGNSKLGRPPKLEKSVEEDLIAEVQRLRMENEYLKKLNALALSRIKSENETKLE